VSELDRSGGERGARLAARMRWRATSDADLVAAMRKGDYEALREFYARFEPLLARYAARAGLSTESWEDDAHDVLSDVVLALIEGDAHTRRGVRAIHSYVVRAFRNRLLDAGRAARRREQRDQKATSGAATSDERMVLESCSENSVRASGGAEWESPELSPALMRLATALDSSLTVEERQMLTWVSNAVPMRDIARWLRIGYSAAKVRLSRLRSRLREHALRHVNECTGTERAELIDFFRRSAGGPRDWQRSTAKESAAVREARTAEPGGAHGDD
jgi:RNA polymerase sigma factor (sigma-70 family)